MEIDQEQRTNRRWLLVSLRAWGLISALLFTRMCVVNLPAAVGDVALDIFLSSLAGAILTLIVCSLPFRVYQNLTDPERRTARVRETVMCVLAFLALVYVVVSIIITYSRDW